MTSLNTRFPGTGLVASRDAVELVAFHEALDLSVIPTIGLFGDHEIREAFEGDLYDFGQRVYKALREHLHVDEDAAFYIRALFAGFIVVEREDGKLWRHDYTVSEDDQISFTTGVEVMQSFTAADVDDAAAVREATPGNPFLEATESGGGTWRIRVIRAGLSGNGNYYSNAVLREAAPMVEGARVFVKSDQEHLASGGKDVRNLIGALSDILFVEGSGKDAGELQATLKLIEPEGVIAVKLREAWDRGMTGLFGFSIDARGTARKATRDGRTFREATRIVKVLSVDLIVEPGAGGGIIDLIESQQERETVMDREQIIALLEAKGHSRADLEKLDDGQLMAKLTEAVRDLPDDDDDDGSAGNTGLREAIRLVEARQSMRDRINRTKLPQTAKDRLIGRFNEAVSFTEAQVDQAVKDEAEYLAAFVQSGRVIDLGDGITIQAGESRAEKVATMLEAFFDTEHADHRHARSFRECYVEITGDRRVTGRVDNCDQVRLTEALGSGDFSSVLGDAMNRRLIRDYNAQTNYDAWREIADVVPLNDFRTQERTRFGGYGNLPVVAEQDPYEALTSPTDEKASYAPAKRGGTENLSLEMIKNDDVGAIRRIPTNLSRAAKRTLGQFVFDFIRTNPLIYDNVALFHGDHGNLGSTALGTTGALAAARLLMLKQAERDSGQQLALPPRHLLVPFDLEETAVDLFRRNTENDKNFRQSLSLNVIPVWYWTDTTDWALAADKMDVPMIEVGFLDGQEEPELFVQDNPTVGSMFSNDTLTYKIRHIYGGAVVDYRGFFKAVVAG